MTEMTWGPGPTTIAPLAEPRKGSTVRLVLGALVAIVVLGALTIAFAAVNTKDDAPSAGSSARIESCSIGGAAGTVKNTGTSYANNYEIWVNFFDAAGVQVDSGVGRVHNLAPGVTGQWQAPGITRGVAKCAIARVSVS